MKLFPILILVLLLSGCGDLSDTKAPPSAPSPMAYGPASAVRPTFDPSTKAADFPGAVVVDGAVTIGTPNTTEGAEATVWESKIESDTSVESVGGSLTVKLDDETNDTEDTTIFKYRMQAGSLCVAAYYGPALAAAPTWTACAGASVMADGSTWDCGSDGLSKECYYTGSAWIPADRNQQSQALGEGTGQTLTVYGFTELTSDADAAAETGTLGSGLYVGQIKTIVMTTDGGDNWELTITNHVTSDPEAALFDAVDEYLSLVWTGTEWATLGNSCTFP